MTLTNRNVPWRWICGVGLALCLMVAAVTTLRGRRATAPDLSKMTMDQVRAAADRNPTASMMSYLFARTEAAGDGKETLAVAKRFVDLFPNDARAHNDLGVAYAANGDVSRAKKAFDTAISLDPKRVDPYVNTGRLAIMVGDHRRAQVEFDRATAVDPKSASAWTGYGEAEANLHNQGDAVDHFKRAIQLAPNRPDAYALLGSFLAEMSHGDEAKPYLKKALDLGYHTSGLYSGLAMAYADQPESQDDLQKALEYADEAARLGDKGGMVTYARGLALQRLGRYREAIPVFRRVIAISENANGPWIGISQCYRQLGNTKLADEAAKTGERILADRQRVSNLQYQIQNSPNRLDLREQYADLMMKNGQYLRAADQYRYIAVHSPDHPERWLRAAHAFELGGEKDLADYVRPFATPSKNPGSHAKDIAKGN